jgi:UDP-glucose 4-epimerase
MISSIVNTEEILVLDGAGHTHTCIELIKSGYKVVFVDNICNSSSESLRPGDIATCYADPTYAAEKLNWKAECGLDEMCDDAWRW